MVLNLQQGNEVSKFDGAG